MATERWKLRAIAVGWDEPASELAWQVDGPPPEGEDDAVPVVPAVLSEELVTRLAPIVAYGYPFEHPDDNAGPESTVREVLAELGFVSEPSTGGEV